MKSDYLKRKTDTQRVRAMHIIRDVLFPFLLKTFDDEEKLRDNTGKGADDEQMTDDDLVDSRLTLLNDIILELFEKVRDIYCILEGLSIIKVQLLQNCLKIDFLKQQLLTRDFVSKLLVSVSSPNVHVPQYNFRTRHLVYQIYEMFTLERGTLLNKVDECLFISCVMSAVEGEGDPRNLVLVYQLEGFILQTFCQRGSKIESSQLEMFLEDIFEKVSCYFPINFTPPKNDVFKISPAQLK